jgi:protein-disulfide isomerase
MVRERTLLAVANQTSGPGAGPSKAQRRAQRAEQQRAELAARKRQERTRRIALISGAVVALAALIAVLVAVGINQSGGGGSSANLVAAGRTTKAEGVSLGWTYGQPSAAHQVVVYEDFMCPFCGAFEQTGHAALQKLADEGKVYLDYRPIHWLPEDYSSQALNAFGVVRRAYPTGEVAKNFHNLLFEKDVQPTESACGSGGSGCLTPQDLLKLAVQAGASSAKVQGILSTGSMQAWADAATAQGRSAIPDGGGTPTVYLDGKEFTDATGTSTDPEFAGVINLANNLVKAVQ